MSYILMNYFFDVKILKLFLILYDVFRNMLIFFGYVFVVICFVIIY